jgi:hypothetical protein
MSLGCLHTGRRCRAPMCGRGAESLVVSTNGYEIAKLRREWRKRQLNSSFDRASLDTLERVVKV